MSRREQGVTIVGTSLVLMTAQHREWLMVKMVNIMLYEVYLDFTKLEE